MRSFVVPLALVLCLAAPHTHVAAQWRPDQTASSSDADEQESQRRHTGTPESRRYKPQKPDAESILNVVPLELYVCAVCVADVQSAVGEHAIDVETDEADPLGELLVNHADTVDQISMARATTASS